jgi:hypothetical protein
MIVTLARRLVVATLAFGAALAGLALMTTGNVAIASSSPAPGLDDDWTRGTHDLLAFVPREFRASCEALDPDTSSDVDQSVLDAQRGALSCTSTDGKVSVIYSRFASSDDADAYIAQEVHPATTDDASDDPGDCPTQFRVQRGKDDTDVGQYYCFLAQDADGIDNGTPIITWTYEPEGIVAQAHDREADLARLRKFWSDDAGPLSSPDRRGIPPLATAAQLRARGKALLGSVPAASRPKCHVIDDFTPDGLQSAYSWRLWIVADVEECRPERGSKDTEYLQFTNTGAMQDYYDATQSDDFDRDERVHVDGYQCGAFDTYRRDGQKAGTYSCWFSNKDTDAKDTDTPFVHLLFTDTRHHVVGAGGAPATQAKALLSWWIDDAQIG